MTISTRHDPNPDVWGSQEAIQGTINALREIGVDINDEGVGGLHSIHPEKVFLAYQIGHLGAGEQPRVSFDEFMAYLAERDVGQNVPWLRRYGIEVPA